MSQHSLYESNWINLVFENRNKEYGAFQLRQETTKTSFNALFIGILVCTALVILPNLLLHPKEITVPTVPEMQDRIIELTDIYQAEIQEAAAAALPAQQQTATEEIDNKQLINPTVVSTIQATPVVEFTLERTNPVESTTDGLVIAGSGNGTGEGVANGTGSGIGTGTATDGTGSGTETHIAAMLDKKPQFPGGIEKFYRYVGNNFRSPIMDETKSIRIFVSFVVERDGSMSNIKVLNKPGQALEKEAIRVLQSIKTKWTPGMLNSKPVRTAYNLPITVLID
ncbi:energy transducer TonB [Flavobacterium sp. FZUC8N2.13]|uniref:Energy transducer TonB n=1 Tax=Flavobacterium zubiriense TaxID=3138075 RepID=A0ABV4TG28_9FLAO